LLSLLWAEAVVVTPGGNGHATSSTKYGSLQSQALLSSPTSSQWHL
jgi:hypothetical protein